MRQELEAARQQADAARQQAEAARQEADTAHQEVERLKGEAGRVESERNALVEENQRWDDLKKQFETERAGIEAKVKAATDEASELKLANRSYMKKISKLLEEMEQLKTSGGGGSAGAANAADLAALKEENTRVRAEAEAAARELAAAQDQVREQASRIAALEAGSSTPTAAPAPAPTGAGLDLTPIRDAVDRINEVASEMRTAMDVLGSVLPDLTERLPAADDRDEMVEQVTGATNDLGGFARQIKEEILKARKALQ